MRTPPSVATGSVAIIERDDSIRTMIEAVLGHAGFCTQAFGEIEEAAAFLETGDVDAIVRDLNLTRSERATAAQQLVSTAPELLRVVDQTVAAKVFAVIRKPFDVDELVSVVRTCTRRSRESKEEEARVPSMNMHTVQRFVKSVPALRNVLSGGMPTPRELLLRNEMRRTIRQLAEALYEAAEAERNRTRAAAFFAASAVAADLAAGPARTARAASLRGDH
jgi:DNA-binding NtrC family response regulator